MGPTMTTLSTLRLAARVSLALSWPVLAIAGDEARLDHIVWLQGSSDQVNPIVAYLKEQLPGLSHETLGVNAIRSWQMIQRGETACRPTTVRTRAREAEAYFADTMLSPPPELLVRRALAQQVPRDADGAADLDKLLNQRQLRGAYARGRSFGDVVDDTLAAHSHNPLLTHYATTGWGDRMRLMLVRGRTDYLIDAPGALAQLRSLGLPADDYQTLPIHGATDPLLLGIACPRNAWGRAAILAIDRALGTPAGAQRLREISRGWFSALDAERFAAQLDRFFARRSQPMIPP